MSQTDDGDDAGTRQSLWAVTRSVLASMFGVQSSRQHQEDFRHGKAWHYILIGLIATAVFVLLLWGLVRLVIGLVQP